ncbi:asparagine synthase (glutamine-hydrolyzing) [Caldovatus aquaticus]|uniref:asparagine synthase (glutamine-hydrolyzing) n=1 Tax=Caldovatus aquaticus TaxID=2865671 RepID=A0ABS7F6R2_9PROT|nr:asparagine synthase (glutamine-hydrolyzing) [Caldovatus aquaticus]MBW8271290.1 asparagine synthase (glutamine-hydrolyzing) [Caldovatus aquaticus]
MCGIAGLLRLDGRPAGREALRAMAAAMAHRGPDDDGLHLDGPLGLSFRRLAILDLSPSGHQPMATACGRHVIVFNGEIYNHRALRARLEAEGAAPAGGWRSGSDTETLLHACAAWGAARACRAANGMFAFAWWDARERRLTLARDRFGKKPLFLVRDAGRGIAFASELRALRAGGAAPAAAVDRRRLAAFLCYRFVPGEETLLAGVEPLPPGTILELAAAGGAAAAVAAAPRPYYDYDFSRGPPAARDAAEEAAPEGGDAAPALLRDEAEAVALLHRLLEDAVRLRLLSDVPFGAFLSGGLDSSLVVALMARLHPDPIKTYSVGFDTGFSEAGHAARVARHLGTDHHELTVGAADLVRAIPAALWSRETPISEPSDIPIYLLARLAREKVTVVLSGEGADEAFAGYPKYAALAAADSAPARAVLAVPGARPLLGAVARAVPAALRRAQTMLEAFALSERFEHHAAWFGAFPAAERRALLSPALFAEAEAQVHRAAARALDGRPAGGHAFPSPVEEALYLDTRLWLPANLLLRGDRMTMAHSLELRCPFLDWRVVEFAARRLPRWMKVRGWEGKRILKLLAEGPVGLPREIVRRPKWGFKVPVGAWFRGPPLGGALRAALLSREALGRGWYREAALRRLVEDHAAGRADNGRKLWILFQLELWHRMFVDGTLAPTDELPA